MLLRNWENLTSAQKGIIRDLERANRRAFRAWQLKEELRDIMAMPLAAARRALDDWLAYATRSRLAPFVKLARTVRHYRTSIEATIEWKLTNGISESNNAAIVRVPAETGHAIRSKPATCSGANRPPVPVDSDHRGRMTSDG